MTTKELVVFFGKSDDTISRAAKQAGIEIKNGVKKVWTREEVEEISKTLYRSVPEAVKESIRVTFSKPEGQPSANAKVRSKLPSGVQLQALLSLLDRGVLNRSDIKQLLGLGGQPQQTVAAERKQIEGPGYVPKDDDRPWEAIKQVVERKALGAAEGAARNVVHRELDKANQDRLNGHLHFEGN